MKTFKKTLLSIGLLFVFVFVNGIVFVGQAQSGDETRDINGYGKTVWGMSADEVLNTEPDRVEKLDKPEKFNMSVAILGIKEIQIGSNKFRARFLFADKDKKLIQVNLMSFEQNNPGINSRIFSSIEQLLTEKYGVPTYKQEKKNASWKLPKDSNRTYSYVYSWYRDSGYCHL